MFGIYICPELMDEHHLVVWFLIENQIERPKIGQRVVGLWLLEVTSGLLMYACWISKGDVSL